MDGAQARGEAGVAVEEGAPCELRPSPEERASWPSYLWWCWLSPLMAEGHKRPLQAQDLYELRDEERTVECARRWNQAWALEEQLAQLRLQKRDRDQLSSSREKTETGTAAAAAAAQDGIVSEGSLAAPDGATTSRAPEGSAPALDPKTQILEAELAVPETPAPTVSTPILQIPGPTASTSVIGVPDPTGSAPEADTPAHTAPPCDDTTEARRQEAAALVSPWRVLFRCFGREFVTAALWKPVWFGTVVLQVYTLKALVTAADPRSELTWWWAALLVAAMFLTSEVQSVSQHHTFTLCQRIGMRSRACVCVAVFQKALKLRLVATAGTTSGQMLNLITNDTQKLVDALTYFHYVWSAPIELLLICALVVTEAGVAALGGILVVFTAQPLQIILARKVASLRPKALKHTDARVRLLGEVLSGIRVVKLNGWVPAFLSRIEAVRTLELKWLRRAAYVRSTNSIFKDSVTPLASLLTFSIYIALHNGDLPPAMAFAVLAFFSIMVRVFFIAPQGLQFLGESIVGMRRLQRFLALPSGEEPPALLGAASELREESPGDVAVLREATFSWAPPPAGASLANGVEPGPKGRGKDWGGLVQGWNNATAKGAVQTHGVHGGVQNGPSPRLVRAPTRAISFGLRSGTSGRWMPDRTSPGSLVSTFDSLAPSKGWGPLPLASFRSMRRAGQGEGDGQGTWGGLGRSITGERKALESFLRKSFNSRSKVQGRDVGGGGLAAAGGVPRQGFEFRLCDLSAALARGEHVAVVGSVGSGKSSLLLALLGEMTWVSGSVFVSPGNENRALEPASEGKANCQVGNGLDGMTLTNGSAHFDSCKDADNPQVFKGRGAAMVHTHTSCQPGEGAQQLVPSAGTLGFSHEKEKTSVAYAPQLPWIFNGTIRDNIVFGNAWDPRRYSRVVHACALDPDIAQLPQGDATEIGERGVNLSGGQKARIGLARACYSTSPILLLDDPLAAVDTTTARHILSHLLGHAPAPHSESGSPSTSKAAASDPSHAHPNGAPAAVPHPESESPSTSEGAASDGSHAHTTGAPTAAGVASGHTNGWGNGHSRTPPRAGPGQGQGQGRGPGLVGEPLLRGRAMVLVTHNQASLGLCSRVLLMDSGRLSVQESAGHTEGGGGSGAELVQEPTGGSGEQRSVTLEGSAPLVSPQESERSSAPHPDSGEQSSVTLEGSAPLAPRESEQEDSQADTEKQLSFSTPGAGEGCATEGKEVSLRCTSEGVPACFVPGCRGPLLKLHDGCDGGFPVGKGSNPALLAGGSATVKGGAEVTEKGGKGEQEGSAGKEETAKEGEVTGEGTKGDPGTGGSGSTRGQGEITAKEDRVEGKVSANTYCRYMQAAGGPILGFALLASFLVSQAVRTLVDYWLGVWVDGKYDLQPGIYALFYAVLTLSAVVLSLMRALWFTASTLAASRNLHSAMALHVLRAPPLFFDQNPQGRILNRFSKDQSLVDELLPMTAQITLELFLGCAGAVAIIAVLVPWFLLTLPPLGVIFVILQRRYVRVSRELKRLDGLSRSPIYAHFAQTAQGIVSIRAYGATQRVLSKYMALIDANHRAYVLFVNSGRWLGVRLDLCAAICVMAAALTVVLLRGTLPPGLAGVILVQSVQLTGLFQYAIRQAAETENYFTSVERIGAYASLEMEADPDTPAGVIGPHWPEHGQIDFLGVSMAYREGLACAVNGLTCTIRAGEKVGVVGRTGAGKSSLVAVLLRMVENGSSQGRVVIDGVDTRLVGLDDLRRRISVIPQEPLLFRGSVRENLDPFGDFSDIELLEALKRSHLRGRDQVSSPQSQNRDQDGDEGNSQLQDQGNGESKSLLSDGPEEALQSAGGERESQRAGLFTELSSNGAPTSGGAQDGAGQGGAAEGLGGGEWQKGKGSKRGDGEGGGEGEEGAAVGDASDSELRLDDSVAEGGDNFSAGQRQLLCLARALLRNSKVVILDEATAAVDLATDRLVQGTVRREFENSTVLSIAHRLETVIDCDRVLVLGPGGKLLEFDRPANLLAAKGTGAGGSSVFAEMVSQAGPQALARLTLAAQEASTAMDSKRSTQASA